MKTSKTWRLLAVVLALGMVVGACGDDDDDVETSTQTSAATKTAPTFASGSTMAALQQKGKIVVGTKFDQPLMGQKNPTTGKVEGFDVEIANLIAKGLFGDNIDGKVEFIEAVSKNREPFIQEGKVDIVVATYTINDARKQVVSFAGPYFAAEQDIMVRADDTSIKSVDDLNGKKVCSAQGSTSIKNIQAKAPQADTSITFDVYSLCAQALGDGRVAAVSTDNTILAGLVKDSGGKFKLVNAPFSEEPYGIGMKKDANDLRAFVNDRLEEIFKDGSWKAAFEKTLGTGGVKTPEPPTIERY